jgi:T5SS/PEP-CTERM-associated repeat protein/autotransporter-associated beta strand protein
MQTSLTIGQTINSSNNSVVVTGAGSSWNAGNTGLNVGVKGSGNSMTISDGGNVSVAGGAIGLNSGANNNSVLVTGSGSAWILGNLTIGQAGGGTLTVADGGMATSTEITVASQSGSSGILNIGRYGTNDTAGTINAPKITFGSGTGTINFNQSNTSAPLTVISGHGTVNQLGSGTTTLSANNTYTGTTTVSSGTLLANSTTALGTSTVMVTNSGTLGGNGTIGGATTIASGGNLKSGSSGAGALSFSAGLTLESGSTTTFLINSAGDFTSINFLGNTSTYGGNLVFNMASYTPMAGDAFTLFNMTGGATQSGDFSSVTAGSLIFTESSGIWNANYGGYAYQFSQPTGQLSVAFQAVPEPSTYALIGLGALALLIPHRRKSRKVA